MRFTVLIIVALCWLSACVTSPEPGPEQPLLADDRELIVLTSESPDRLIERASQRGYTVKETYPLDDLNEVLIVFDLPDGRTIPDAIAEIEKELPEVTAGAHHLYTLQLDGLSDVDLVYANTQVGWPAAACPASRKIGMVDNGVKSSYPGLSDGRIVQDSFVAGDDAPKTDHGSLMADLLIGSGRLTGTTLYSANVVDPARASGDTAGVVSILRAINWLDSEGVDVVNISLSGPRNKLLNRGLQTAAASGMIMVAAAGNDGPSAPPQFPAAFPFVLAVTAIDRDENVFERAVQGSQIDFAAPGVDILMPMEGRLRILSGTSYAVPFVTAIIAADAEMLGLDVDGVRARLSESAVDLGVPGKDPVFGNGLVRTPESCLTASGT